MGKLPYDRCGRANLPELQRTQRRYKRVIALEDIKPFNELQDDED